MKKILSTILACVMLCGVILPITANADSAWTNPYRDVADNAWYAPFVEYCASRGLMNGTSAATFAPDLPVTRAMLVTIIAAYDKADLQYYTTSPFDDVPEGEWYSAPIAWAAREGIVSGTGEGKFAPDRAITREELATLLRTYAEYAGFYSKYIESENFADFSDLDQLDGWAETGTKWACAAGLISGASASDGTSVLAPKMTATRAQIACMIMRLDESANAENDFTIAGRDISEYSIVISDSATEDTQDAAKLLAKYIKQAYGVDVPTLTDTNDPAECEILIGKTNREDTGLVTVDRESENDLSYVIDVQGTRLVIAGQDDSRGGSRYGAYDFCEDALGYHFYMDSEIRLDRVSAHLTDDYELRGGPAFKSRTVYWKAGWDDVMCNDEYYRTVNWVHELPKWIDPSLDAASETPCLTSEENIQKVVDKVRSLLTKNYPKGKNVVWISQGDSYGYCKCENCRNVYREDGKGSTVFRLCNRVSDELIDEFPNFKIMTLAYDYTTAPPKTTVLRDNVIVYYCASNVCHSHPYNDPDCDLNAVASEEIVAWKDKCSELFVWDYSTNFSCTSVPSPNFHELRPNAEFFYDNNYRGVFNNAVSSRVGEFGDLRAFLLTRLYRDPKMGDAQYFKLMNGFLRQYYGDGWAGIRDFIDLIDVWSEESTFGMNSTPFAMYNYNRVDTALIDRLWDEAEERAVGDQFDHVRQSRICATLLVQCVNYQSQFVSGTAEQREAYCKRNDELYADILKYNIRWNEDGDEIRFNREKAPDKW